MLVDRADLEASLEKIRAGVRDPAAGIMGPGSHGWALNRESINFIGGVRAALLQLAHPYVAYAIDQHSKTRDDVMGRFNRTFINVFAMIFGDLEQAFRSARIVHAVHTRIRGPITDHVGPFQPGHEYRANETPGLIWVWATLVDTVVRVHELVVRRLPDSFKQRFYEDQKTFAYLFGIPESELPPDWPAFEDYVERMFQSDTLTVSPPALDMSKFLTAAPRRAVVPVTGWMKIMTAGLMPPRLREQFELRWTAADRAAFAASIAIIRPLVKVTPRAVRYIPAYVESMSRLGGRDPSRVSRFVERLANRGIATATAR